jgi:hypothetical protein
MAQGAKMTHDDLLIEINRRLDVAYYNGDPQSMRALRAVVELHKNNGSKYTLGYGQVAIELCEYCRETYPCQTIQAIKKELQ